LPTKFGVPRSDGIKKMITKIFKPPLVVHHGVLGNTCIKRKSSLKLNGMVEVTKGVDKMIVASIDKIHIINLEIKEQHSQVQKKLQI
jgi:hypothetical protein